MIQFDGNFPNDCEDGCVQKGIEFVQQIPVAYMSDAQGTRYVHMDDLGTVLTAIATLQVVALEHTVPPPPDDWQPETIQVEGKEYVEAKSVTMIVAYAAMEGVKQGLEVLIANAYNKLNHGGSLIKNEVPDEVPTEWIEAGGQ